jgi:fumarate reductase subunit D
MKFLFLMIFGLTVVILVSYALPLPASMPQAWSGERNLFASLIALVYGIIGLAWLFLFVVRGAWRGMERIDADLAELGFALSRKSLFLRHYETDAEKGRTAEVTIRPAYRLEPWRMEIRVEPAYDGYLALGNRKPLLVKSGMTKVLIDAFPYTEMQILAEDETATKLYLGKPEVRDHLAALISRFEAVTGWEIYFEPEKVWTSIRTYQLSNRQVSGWVKSLLKLPTL